MIRALILVLAMASAAPAHAGEAEVTFANIQKRFPQPKGALTTNDIPTVQTRALLFVILARKYPDSDPARKAKEELERLRPRLAALKDSLSAELKPKEEVTKAALSRAQAVADQLRKEIHAKAKTGVAPPLRVGACVALDYGGPSSLYGIAVVKVGKTAPHEAWAKLVFRAKDGDAEALGDAWKGTLVGAKDWEVPEEAFAGGLGVTCARGTELYRKFEAARALGQVAAPIAQNLRAIENIYITMTPH